MRLTAKGCAYHRFIDLNGADWPAEGDAAIDLPHVSRLSLPGACGASAIAVLIFKDDRITKVGESVRYFAVYEFAIVN